MVKYEVTIKTESWKAYLCWEKPQSCLEKKIIVYKIVHTTQCHDSLLQTLKKSRNIPTIECRPVCGSLGVHYITKITKKRQKNKRFWCKLTAITNVSSNFKSLLRRVKQCPPAPLVLSLSTQQLHINRSYTTVSTAFKLRKWLIITGFFVFCPSKSTFRKFLKRNWGGSAAGISAEDPEVLGWV